MSTSSVDLAVVIDHAGVPSASTGQRAMERFE